MLRLTRIVAAHSAQTIKLEGKLLGPWVDEVRKACISGTVLSARTSLDLSALTFVDVAGERLLRDLIGRGIEVVACSNYVAELLRLNAGIRLLVSYIRAFGLPEARAGQLAASEFPKRFDTLQQPWKTLEKQMRDLPTFPAKPRSRFGGIVRTTGSGRDD